MLLHGFADRPSFSSRFNLHANPPWTKAEYTSSNNTLSLMNSTLKRAHFIALYSTCWICWNTRELRIQMCGVLFGICLALSMLFFFSLFNLLCLFSPKVPRLTRRGRLWLSFQFRMEIEKPDKKLVSSPGIYNHGLGVREGAVSRYFLGPQMLVAFKGPFLLCNSHLPHLYMVLIWLYPGIVD